MVAQIVIRHSRGSKVNQVEQFPLDQTGEITFGRAPGNMIVYDPARDDTVSRRHAVLRVRGGDRPGVVIAELGSSNGTFVNGSRLSGERELMPGDTVELGSGGPTFVFDIQPRPATMVGPTRIMSVPEIAQATRLSPVWETPADGMRSTRPADPASTKAGVGRETVQRMLSSERKAHSRSWMYILSGVLLAVAAGGGGVYYLLSQASRQQQQRVDAAQARIAQSVREEAATREKERGMSAEDIAHKFGNATVQVFMTWRAIDKDTGKPIYHKVVTVKGTPLPCYVRIPDVGVVRWLTSEDEDRNNHLVGGAGQGSGFVVTPGGFIMTNKHIAAGWRIQYLAYSEEYEDGKGLLFQLNDLKAQPRLIDLSTSEEGRKALKSWVPSEGAIIFEPKVPIALAGSKNQITGENLDLSVRFPGNTTPIQAKLVSASEEADAAEIKIDTGQSLTAVSMATEDNVRVGQRVTVLGFPGFSTETHALRTSIEGGERHNFDDVVPEPTVTEGLISLLSPPPKQIGDVTMVGEMGDAYQLTAPTSHGNSGGPVFDADGRVVALFTYGDPRRETHTFAVPIRYARDLMQMQRAD